MTSFVERALTDATSRLEGYRARADVLIRQVGVTNPIAESVGGDYSELTYSNRLSKHTEQLRHFRGWTYVAINRIATKLAGQKVCMGRIVAESLEEQRRRMYKSWQLPAHVKAYADDDELEVIQTHPLLMAIKQPNPVMVQWALLYSTVAGLELTGRIYWWMPVVDGHLNVWPIPADWITPKHTKERLHVGFELRPPGHIGDAYQIPPEDIAVFTLPDPSNPVESFSPLRAQAPAIATDESMQMAQYRSFKNDLFPSMLLTDRGSGADIEHATRDGLLEFWQDGQVADLSGLRRKSNYRWRDCWIESSPGSGSRADVSVTSYQSACHDDRPGDDGQDR